MGNPCAEGARDLVWDTLHCRRLWDPTGVAEMPTGHRAFSPHSPRMTGLGQLQVRGQETVTWSCLSGLRSQREINNRQHRMVTQVDTAAGLADQAQATPQGSQKRETSAQKQGLEWGFFNLRKS